VRCRRIPPKAAPARNRIRICAPWLQAALGCAPNRQRSFRLCALHTTARFPFGTVISGLICITTHQIATLVIGLHRAISVRFATVDSYAPHAATNIDCQTHSRGCASSICFALRQDHTACGVLSAESPRTSNAPM
jgi:hypothetical protein